MPKPRLELRVLGGFELTRAGEQEPLTLPSKKARALLTYLALAPRQPVSRAKLAATLWPASVESSARASLRQALASLRKLLDDGGAAVVRSETDGIAVDYDGLWVDALELESRMSCGDVERSVAGAELCAGPLLDGLDVYGDPFDEWLTRERARYNDLMCEALWSAFKARRVRDDIPQARAAARRMVAFAPLREDVHRALIQLCLDEHKWNDALELYERCEERLRRSLGIEPDAQTLALRDAAHRGRRAARHDQANASPPQAESVAPARASFADEGKPSIVVLPFGAATEEDDYLADGMTEDITTELSRFGDLVVISRNTAFSYKGRATAEVDVARELGVDYFVKGTVRRSGERVRVTAQLIAASDGRHVWGQRYEQQLAELFELQDHLTAEIVAVLPGRVQHHHAHEITRQPPEDMRAYELLLAARTHHHRCTKTDYEYGLTLLDRALKLVPNYAAALAWKACLLGQAIGRGFAPDPKDLFEQSRALVEHALQLDHNELEGHRILAEIAMTSHDLDAARRHNSRAIEINPNDPRLAAQKGELLTWSGDAQEGERWISRAMRLDPYCASGWSHLLGLALLHQCKFAEAIEAYASSPNPRLGHRADHCACQRALGNDAGASKCAAQVLAAKPDFSCAGYVASLPYASDACRRRHLELLQACPLPA